MDAKVEHQRAAPKMAGLRTRVTTRMEDEDGCQVAKQSSRTRTAQDDLTRGAEGARLFTSRLMTAQDDLANGAERTRIFRDDSPTLTPTTSTPQSLSPTPPSDGCLANFGIVMPGIYRSAWPAVEAHEFMRGMGLKTIITLVEKDEPDAEYAEFMERNGIRQLVFGIQGTKKQAIPAETMRAVLQVLLDKANHPVLIHCNRGRHRTGCVVGALRKLYGWDLPTVLSEYHNFADPKPREPDVQYLTAVEPAKLFTGLRDMAPVRPLGNFPRMLAFVFFCLLVWFMTMYRIASILPVERRR